MRVGMVLDNIAKLIRFIQLKILSYCFFVRGGFDGLHSLFTQPPFFLWLHTQPRWNSSFRFCKDTSHLFNGATACDVSCKYLRHTERPDRELVAILLFFIGGLFFLWSPIGPHHGLIVKLKMSQIGVLCTMGLLLARIATVLKKISPFKKVFLFEIAVLGFILTLGPWYAQWGILHWGGMGIGWTVITTYLFNVKDRVRNAGYASIGIIFSTIAYVSFANDESYSLMAPAGTLFWGFCFVALGWLIIWSMPDRDGDKCVGWSKCKYNKQQDAISERARLEKRMILYGVGGVIAAFTAYCIPLQLNINLFESVSEYLIVIVTVVLGLTYFLAFCKSWFSRIVVALILSFLLKEIWKKKIWFVGEEYNLALSSVFSWLFLALVLIFCVACIVKLILAFPRLQTVPFQRNLIHHPKMCYEESRFSVFLWPAGIRSWYVLYTFLVGLPLFFLPSKFYFLVFIVANLFVLQVAIFSWFRRPLLNEIWNYEQAYPKLLKRSVALYPQSRSLARVVLFRCLPFFPRSLGVRGLFVDDYSVLMKIALFQLLSGRSNKVIFFDEDESSSPLLSSTIKLRWLFYWGSPVWCSFAVLFFITVCFFIFPESNAPQYFPDNFAGKLSQVLFRESEQTLSVKPLFLLAGGLWFLVSIFFLSKEVGRLSNLFEDEDAMYQLNIPLRIKYVAAQCGEKLKGVWNDTAKNSYGMIVSLFAAIYLVTLSVL